MNLDIPLEELDKSKLHFIGKVGNFCPVKVGAQLVREGTDKNGNTKYDAVTGTKGYLWQDAEVVKETNDIDNIDKTYYQKLVDDAIYSIEKYDGHEGFFD